MSFVTKLAGMIGSQVNRITGVTEATNKANAQELAMWNLNNEYNSPAQQMKRLKDAGLNPALVYGTGSSVATGVSKSAPQAHSEGAGLAALSSLLSAISLGQDIQAKGQENAIRSYNLEYAREQSLPYGAQPDPWERRAAVINNAIHDIFGSGSGSGSGAGKSNIGGAVRSVLSIGRKGGLGSPAVQKAREVASSVTNPLGWAANKLLQKVAENRAATLSKKRHLSDADKFFIDLVENMR